MELLFGVAGPSHAVPVVCDRLTAESSRSNPGLALKIVNDDALAVGYALRRFASWTSPDDLSFHLDGELRSIEGRTRLAPTRLMRSSDGLLKSTGAILSDSGNGSTDPTASSFGMAASYLSASMLWAPESLLVDSRGRPCLPFAPPGPRAPRMGTTSPRTMARSPSFSRLASIRPLGPHIVRSTTSGAGEVLQFADGVARVREHLSMVYRAARPHRSRRVLVDELVDLVGAAVRNAARSLEAPVFPLSGGLDSRYLVAEFIECFGPVPTITWGADPARHDSDAVIARRVAKSLAVENTWFEKPRTAHSGDLQPRHLPVVRRG